ncbi:MAG: aminotransferase class V-fold PLP-dependent enzyme, partial [Delftia sp.]|nr:aminotransferase class V-fold PLP-dependent enzyme [Delftia sp.]
MSAINVAEIRAGIPALEQCIYLNSGTFGPLPSVVADEIRRAYGLVEQWGTFAPRVFRELELEGLEKVRCKVANFMHSEPDEIAFSHNVTDGINIVLHGLDWSAGDEVVISDQEHPAGAAPWLELAQRRGVVLRLLPVRPDADEMAALLQGLVGPRTRLVCLSHVSCLSGARLPVERLCAVARAAGALTLLDGAHAEGQFPVDVPATGADFYAACGHKWLLGPQGTGMFYARRESLGQLRPAWLGWGVNKPFDRQNMRYELEASAARFEQSTQAWPLYLALGRAIDHIQEIGLLNVQTRVRQLVTHFRQALSTIPGLTFHSPAEPERATGLLTCSIPGWEAEALKGHLWQSQRTLTNHIQEFNALRFSVAFFNTKAELETVTEALAQAARRP